MPLVDLPPDAQLDELPPPNAPPPQRPAPTDLPPGAELDPVKRYVGQILPFSTDEQGKTQFDPTAGVLGQFVSGVTLPGQVYSGEVQTPYSSSGQTDPNLMPRTAGLASMLALDRGGLPRTAPPTAQELQAAGRAGYQALENSNLAVQGSEVSGLGSTVRQNLLADFLDNQAAPQTHAVIDGLTDAPSGGYMAYPQLVRLRQRLTDLSMAGGSEGRAAIAARRHLDDFLGNLQDSQLQQGTLLGTPTMTGQEAAQIFNDARANTQGAMKSNELVGGLGKGDTGMLQQAETRASATNSGQNVSNTIRQRIASFLANDNNLYGYTPDEIAALRAAAAGSNTQDALRFLGNRGTIMSAIGALFGGGGAESAIGVGAGQGLARVFKAMENSIGRQGLQDVDAMVRQNTPLGRVYQGTPSPYPRSPPTVAPSPQIVRPPGSERLIVPGLLAPQQGQPIPWWQLEGRA